MGLSSTETASGPPAGKTSRIVVDKTAVTIGSERYWLYAAIDVETELLLGAVVSKRPGTNPADEFLGQLVETHELLKARM